MAPLTDLLGNILFPGVPSNAVYDLIKVVWNKATNKAWEELYLDAFQEALNQSKPYLKKYAGKGDDITLNRDDLSNILHWNLAAAIDTWSYSQLSDDEFISKLAHAMEAHQVLLIAGHNLSETDYSQIIHNLVDGARTLFKEAILNNEQAFRRAILEETLFDQALVRQLQDYLVKQLGPSVSGKLKALEGKIDDVSIGIQHIEQILTSLRYFRTLEEYLLEPGPRFPKLNDFEEGLIYLPEKYVSDIQNHLKVKRRALVVGRSAAGKTVFAIALAKHFQETESYTVFYGDVALAEQGDGRKWYQIIRANDRKGTLYILDNCHLAPKEASEFCFQWDGTPPEYAQCIMISRPESDDTLSDEIEDYFDRCADETVKIASETIYYDVLEKYAAAYQRENSTHYVALENDKAALLEEQHAHNLIASRTRLQTWRKIGGRLSEVKQEEVYKILEQKYLSYARKTLSALCALWQFEIPAHYLFVEEILDPVEVQYLREQRMLFRSNIQGYGDLYEVLLHPEEAREIFEAAIYRQRHFIDANMVNTELISQLRAYLKTKPPNYIFVYRQLHRQKQETVLSSLLMDRDLQDCAAEEFKIGNIFDAALYLFILSKIDLPRAQEMLQALISTLEIKNVCLKLLDTRWHFVNALRYIKKIDVKFVQVIVEEMSKDQSHIFGEKMNYSTFTGLGNLIELLGSLNSPHVQVLIDTIDMKQWAQRAKMPTLQRLFWMIRALNDISPIQAKRLLENIPVQFLVAKANVSDLSSVEGLVVFLRRLEYPADELRLFVETMDMEQLARRVETPSLQKLYWLIRSLNEISPLAVNRLLKAITPTGLVAICLSKRLSVHEYQNLANYLPKSFWLQCVKCFTDQDLADIAGRSSISRAGSFFLYRFPYLKQSYMLFREQYLLEKLATESIGDISKFIYRMSQVPAEGHDIALDTLDLLMQIDLSERIANNDLKDLSLLLYTIKKIDESYLLQLLEIIEKPKILHQAIMNSSIRGIEQFIHNISDINERYINIFRQKIQTMDLTDKLQQADLRDLGFFLWNVCAYIDEVLAQDYCKLVDAQQRPDQLSKTSLDDLCLFLWNLTHISNLVYLQTLNNPIIEERLKTAWELEIGLGVELLGIITIAGSVSIKELPISIIETKEQKENLANWLEQSIQEQRPYILALTLCGLRTSNESVAESIVKEALNISKASELLKGAEESSITPWSKVLLQETLEWLQKTFEDRS